jgi:hypothetical protein
MWRSKVFLFGMLAGEQTKFSDYIDKLYEGNGILKSYI